MPESTLTEKGQTTIPKEIRDHLGLRPGDRMEFVAEAPDRVILLRAGRDVRDLAGILPRPRKPVSLEDMQAAVRRRVARKA